MVPQQPVQQQQKPPAQQPLAFSGPAISEAPQRQIDPSLQFSASSSLPTEPSSLPPAPSGLPQAPSGLPPAPSGLPPAPSGLPAAPSGLPPAPSGLPPAPSALPPPSFPEAIPSGLEQSMISEMPPDYGMQQQGMTSDLGMQPPSDLGMQPPSDIGMQPPSDIGMQQQQGMQSDLGMQTPSDLGLQQQGMPLGMQTPSDIGLQQQSMPSDLGMQPLSDYGMQQQGMPSDLRMDYGMQPPSDYGMQTPSEYGMQPPSDYGLQTPSESAYPPLQNEKTPFDINKDVQKQEAPSLFDRLLGRSKEAPPDDDDPAAFLSRFKRTAETSPALAPSTTISDRTDDLITSLSRFKSDTPSTLDPEKFVSTAYEKEEKEPESPQSAVGKAGIYAFFAGFFSWKWALVVIALSILYWYVRPYILSVNAMLKGLNDMLDTSAEVIIPDEEEAPKKEKQKQKEKKKPTPEPDETTSNVQGGSQSGFCLAGEWKGVRSCVKLRPGQGCVSGQLFPTQETCANPSLRV